MKNRSTLPRPRAAYWGCQAGGWGAYLLINTFVSQGFSNSSGRLFIGNVVLSAAGVLLTHGFRSFLLRRGWIKLPAIKLIPRVLAANLLLAIVLVTIVTIYYGAFPPSGNGFGMRGPMTMAVTWFIYVFNSFIIMTLWSGIYFGVASFQQQRRAEIERYQARTALAEAELRELKSQLNPHFLFNSLNSLRALVVEDPARAQEALTQMAAILRYHLQSGERSLVPLAEELETVEQYLALELIRFDDRLTVARSIDPAALALLVPPLGLQTLVENAIKYGVSREMGADQLEVAATVHGGRLEIAVRNGGALRAASNGSTGLGLANLRTRLRILFSEQASLELTEPQPGQVEARMILPVTKTLAPARK